MSGSEYLKALKNMAKLKCYNFVLNPNDLGNILFVITVQIIKCLHDCCDKTQMLISAKMGHIALNKSTQNLLQLNED